MTYTIRDNTGNIIFSMENTTPEVSFESIDNEFDRLMSYSNKLDKSIEAFDLISNTRAMEALGYVKGAGFKDNVKNISHEIWKKIVDFLKSVCKAIKTAFENIGKKLTNSINELSIKNNVIHFLKSNNINEDFDKMDFESKETYKKILKIYENENTRGYICYCADYYPEIISEISETMNYVNNFDPDDYTKLVDNLISSNKVDTELLTKVATRWKNEKEFLYNHNSNKNETDKINIKTFSSKLIKYMSSDKINMRTLNEYDSKISKLSHDIETSWVPKIDKIKDKVKNYRETLKGTHVEHLKYEDLDFQIDSISNIAQFEIKTISDLILSVSKSVIWVQNGYSAILNVLK